MGFLSDLCGSAQKYLQEKQKEYSRIKARLEHCRDEDLMRRLKTENDTLTRLAIACILKERGYTVNKH